MTSEIRYKNIDGLRGIAVLMVISFHFLNNAYMSSDIIQLSWIERFIMKITSFGWAGVNLFFVLSGFLIGTILLKNKNSESYFKTFYIRRFLRIIPLYYLFLFVYIVCSYIINNNQIELFEKPIPIYFYFLLIQNFLFSTLGHFGPSGLTPSWSLAIEEQFYLFVPFLIYFTNKNRLMLICLFFVVGAPVFRSFTPNWYMEYTHLLSRVDALFLGVILAIVKSDEKRYLPLFSSMWFLSAILIVLLCTYLFISKSINHTLISFFFFIVLKLTFTDRKRKFNFLHSPFFAFVGRLSFFIYLFHQLINGLMFVIFQNGKSPNLNNAESYLIEILSISITFILAVISDRILESRLIKFGKRFQY
jgi:peptidoglycan/LPS O-acetylase OafA/YrhL